MILRRIQLAAVAVILFTLFLVSGVAQPADRGTVRSGALMKVRPAANWTFSGCWTQFSSRPCRDIYRDQEGNAWICKDCGTTGNPGPGKCNPISQATLNSGFWCS
jgi:hypothetical protein